jgi:putative restriction endonuclease
MEDQIRLAAFNWLKTQAEIYGEVFPRNILEAGFDFQGQRITMVGPAGIWKPKQFNVIPISITTILNGPYSDVISEDGFLSYKYRGTDPKHRDNVGLRVAMETKTPLIYFVSLAPGKYMANLGIRLIQIKLATLHSIIGGNILQPSWSKEHINNLSVFGF